MIHDEVLGGETKMESLDPNDVFRIDGHVCVSRVCTLILEKVHYLRYFFNPGAT